MNNLTILIAIFFLGVPLASWSPASNGATFKGAWFEVWVPPAFTAIPSTKSRSAGEGVDSAFFRSPDQQVEFYVFSPQWNTEPHEIALNAATEKLSVTETKRAGSKRITSYTIQAKDGSYARSYQDTSSAVENARLVFGIKYANQSVYNRYKDAYLKFRKSLRQFAD